MLGTDGKKFVELIGINAHELQKLFDVRPIVDTSQFRWRSSQPAPHRLLQQAAKITTVQFQRCVKCRDRLFDGRDNLLSGRSLLAVAVLVRKTHFLRTIAEGETGMQANVRLELTRPYRQDAVKV